MDVVVKSRHCNLSDQFRSYVDEKITRLSKLNDCRARTSSHLQVKSAGGPTAWSNAC